MSEPVPIACRLSGPELAARRRELRDGLLARVQESRVREAGLDLRLSPEKGLLTLVGEFIEEERDCCPFLDFRLEVAPDGGPVWLRLSGPAGTRDFLQDLLQVGGR